MARAPEQVVAVQRRRLATAEELTLYYDEALDAWFTPERGSPRAGAGGPSA